MMEWLYAQIVRKGTVHVYYKYFRYPHATSIDGLLPLASLLQDVHTVGRTAKSWYFNYSQ